jgi:hypothetical protein
MAGDADERPWLERYGCAISSIFMVVAVCTSVWWLPYDLHLLSQALRWLLLQ